jgi:hypothetical protein
MSMDAIFLSPYILYSEKITRAIFATRTGCRLQEVSNSALAVERVCIKALASYVFLCF